MNIAQCPMAMSQSCYALTAKGDLSVAFVYCALKEAITALKQHAVGAVFDAIIIDTFSRISLLTPTKNLGQAFDENVLPVFSQIENLQIQNEKLASARDLLLPRLMDGRLLV